MFRVKTKLKKKIIFFVKPLIGEKILKGKILDLLFGEFFLQKLLEKKRGGITFFYLDLRKGKIKKISLGGAKTFHPKFFFGI